MDKLVTLGRVERFKNFSLETKMAEINGGTLSLRWLLSVFVS